MKHYMTQCQMSDVKSSGQFFTWSNKQKGENKVYCKLDRVIGNEAWMEGFPMTGAIYLPEQKRKPFKFFNMWTKSQKFLEVVKKGWEEQMLGTKMLKHELKKTE